MHNYQDFKVDLTNCDKEPIHVIGRIQPHGFLIIIDSLTFLVEQISENIMDFVPGIPSQQWLGSSIFDLLPESSRDWFENDFLINGYDIIELNQQKYYGINHLSADKIIIECEPYLDPSPNEKLKQLEKLSHLKSQLSQLADLGQMANLVAREMQEYLEYDRV